MAASIRCALAVLLLVCLRAQAQDPYSETAHPTPERIATLLKSGDPRDRAWGAFHAVHWNDASFLPELTGLAERWEPLPHAGPDQPPVALDTRQRNELNAMVGVLDGVIQFNGKLSPKVLLSLADDLPAQAAILLSRLSLAEQEPTLMAIFNNPKPANWVETRFAAHMLMLKPPPTFAAKLMHDMKIEAKIFVLYPLAGAGFNSSSECGVLPADHATGDWPTAGQYILKESASGLKPPIITVVRGRDPLFAMRIPAHGLYRTTGCDLRPLTTPVRIELIFQMLGGPDKTAGLSATVQVNITATDTADYEKKLTEFVTGQLDSFQAVERRLTARGYVSLSEMASGASEPELVLALTDYRTDKSFELPKIVFNRGRVSWSGE